jgi:glycosyltransferase involved in cell wall biosynthesis
LAGAEKQAFYMSRALAEAGVVVRVLNLGRREAYEDALHELNVESRSFGWLPGLPFRLSLLLAGLRGLNPHIIQSVHAYTNVYSAIAARLLGAVSIGGLRSDFRACLADNGAFSRWLLTLPDAIAVNSRRALEDVQKSRLLDPSRLHYLPNAIDLASFPERREAAASNGQECTCICVSRLFPSKRVDVFVRALAIARSGQPALRGTIVGYGPETARLRLLAAELHLLPDALDFLGFRDDVASLLQQSSVFVFCSESEGTPNVILEAMSASLPVITTPAGDAADIVEPARAGYVVPFGDIRAVAEAMTRLAASPVLRARLGKSGHDYVVRHRASSQLARRLLELYAGVARSRSREDLWRRVIDCAERHQEPA